MHQDDNTEFSIVANPWNETPLGVYRTPYSDRMRNMIVPFRYGDFTGPLLYNWGGFNGNGSASPLRQTGQEAAIYEGYAGWPLDSMLTTTREFFARARPHGYMAAGREVFFRLDDTLRAGISAMLHDIWIANDSISLALPMVARDAGHISTNDIGSVQDLFRTTSFSSHDSTFIGLELQGRFDGDTAWAHGYHLNFIAELVNAANDSVVAQLDSFSVSKLDTSHAILIQDTLDLVSGTYFIQMRVESTSLPTVGYMGESLYPVSEVYSYVEEEGMGKLRREPGTAEAKARISAQPNPFSESTEIRWSSPHGAYSSVRVYDGFGRQVGEALSRRWMDVGRYAIEFDGSQLPAGSYLVELMLDRERVVSKLVIVR